MNSMKTAARIALVTPGFSAQADEWAIPALQLLATALTRSFDVTVFSQRYPTRGRYQFEGLTHLAWGGGQTGNLGSLRVWLGSSLAIIRQHRRAPFDLLHAFWADEAGFSAVLAAKVIKRPVVVSLGGWELTHLPEIDYGAQRLLTRRLTVKTALAGATLVTAGSTYQLDLCRAFNVPEGKLCLAPLPVDTDHFRPSEQTNGPVAPTIIQAASLLPVKNQKLLLQVLQQVKAEIPDIRLILVGSGPLRDQLTQLAQMLGIEQNILWLAQIPHRHMPEQYRQAHLYLQTSSHESQGLAVLEAMACGLPALGTPVGILPEVTCRPAQVEPAALARQAIDLLRQPEQYLACRRQARKQVEAGYSLVQVVTNFKRIYGLIK